MGRALTPGGAPNSPHHHPPQQHHHHQPPHNFQNYPPPSAPPPESLYPPKGTTNSVQQQQACNVIASPPPQFYQQNNIAPNPIAFPQQQQNGNYGNAKNKSQPQPLMLHQNAAAIGVPLQVASSPQPQQVLLNNNSSDKMAMVMPWTTGLFDCMDDPNNAMITALFPCITFGQIADVLDNGHTTCTTSAIIYAVAPCIVSRVYRKKLRQRFGLVEAPASDWIVHSIFELCAVCQEYRELTNRGIDPSIGYQGNINNYQSQQNITMIPPSNQTMR